MLCAICSGVHVESRLSEPHWQETRWSISTLSTNRKCELCRILYGMFLRTAGHEAYYRGVARGIVHRVEEIDSTYLQHPTLSVEFVKSIGDSEKTLESSYSLQLSNSPDAAKCVFDGQTLSYTLVKTWLNDCDANHDCIRGHPPRRKNVGFFVIDVQDACIVRAPPNCRYVALSYSWGQVKQTRLKKSNIARLEKKGGLRRKRIPQTIMDALSMCASLGVRYLWVDRLCIVQNSPSHGNSQLAHMDQIYSGAYVTIIAATGSDSASGIFAPRPQNEVQHTVCLENTTYVAVPKLEGLEESLANSVWASRAWTLQEFVLSRRCLIFTGDECFLYCGKGAYVSGLSTSHLLPPPKSFGLSLLGYRLPYWKGDGIIYRRYARLVVSYMSRELSFNKDVLRGFEGISRLLMRYLGRFRCGLPDSIIRWSLCWTHTEPMYRRRWMHTEDLIRKPGIPSWTWAGWEKLETDISNMRPEYPSWSWAGTGKNGQASHMFPSAPAWSWKGLPKSENGIQERRMPAKTSLTFPDYLAHQFWPPCSVYYWTSNVTMRQIPSSFDTSESKCPAFDDECRQSYEYIRDNARWIWNQSLTGKSFSTRSYRRLLSVSSPAFKDVPGVNFRHVLTFASFYASLPVPPKDVLNGQRALEPIPVLDPPSVCEDQVMNGYIPGPSRLRQTYIFLGVLNHPSKHFAVVLPVHIDKLAQGTNGKADQLVVRRCGDPYRVEADAWFNRLSRKCIAHLR